MIASQIGTPANRRLATASAPTTKTEPTERSSPALTSTYVENAPTMKMKTALRRMFVQFRTDRYCGDWSATNAEKTTIVATSRNWGLTRMRWPRARPPVVARSTPAASALEIVLDSVGLVTTAPASATGSSPAAGASFRSPVMSPTISSRVVEFVFAYPLDLPQAQDLDAVGHSKDQLEVVADEDDGPAAVSQLRDDLLDVPRLADPEGGGGFVHHDDPPLLQHRARDRDALALPT